MDINIRTVFGPPSDQITREAAEKGLLEDPHFPKNAKVAHFGEQDGRWVATLAEPVEHVAAPPAFLDTDGSNDGESSDGPPKPPTDDAAGEEDAKPEGPEGEEPKGDEGADPTPGKPEGHGEKGLEHSVHELTNMMHTIMDALGLSTGPDASMVPGHDEGMAPAGPHGPGGAPDSPAGPDTNPSQAGAQGPDGKTHTVHERALKPGEAQPGTTPIGAPAFASVREDHPWSHVAGEAATFTVSDEIGDTPTQDVSDELRTLASEIGYNVRQFRVQQQDGQRVASALISKY